MAANPFLAGIACRCPNCGKGRLFDGFLKVAPVCASCGFDLKAAESGDGPAVFIILIVGGVMAFLTLYVVLVYDPPLWVPLVIMAPMTALLSLAAMRPFKGIMIALQFHNKASEARSSDADHGG